jgi:two-component system aerobic respiration control sensor histidine kinase ArcB
VSRVGKDIVTFLKENYPKDLSALSFENRELKKIINTLANFSKKKSFIAWKMIDLPNAENIIEHILIGKNITEIKRLQEKFENIEIRLESVIESMPGNYWWKDLNGIYRGYNTTLLHTLGLRSKSEVIGKSDYELPWREQAAQLYEHDNIVIKTGKPYISEEIVSSRVGEMLTFLVTKVPLRNNKGKVIGTIGSSVDITKQKELEKDLRKAKEQAEAANRVKTEILENLRHDIRTPLTGIVGFASIIAEESKDPKMKEYVNNLVASSYALNDLLNEILEVIRIGSEIPILKKKFDLKNKLSDVIKLTKPRALQKNIQLIFNYDEKIPHFLIGDFKRIHRIVLELVTNALNFTNQGFVKLSAQLEKEGKRKIVLRIEVEDTGIGIPPEKKQEVFLHFKRLTPSYEGIYKGAGLGLSIVKQFVEELEGEVYIESREEGGTCFIIFLPLKKPLLQNEFGVDKTEILPSREPLARVVPAKEAEGKQLEEATDKSHILLVEDQEVAAKVGKIILTGLNCQVDTAADGKTALALFNQRLYHLVFMGIGLPDIDGYEVTKRIRLLELNTDTHVPIIALTAHVDEENKQHCINVGMNAVLSKPLSKEKARDIIHAFIPYHEQAGKAGLKQKTDSLLTEDKVIDFEVAKSLYGGKKEAILEMVKMLVESFKEEEHHLQEAYDKQGWDTIKAIAHKLKGGSSYCGTMRLKKACDQLETAIKEKRTEDYSRLYHQMMDEIAAVKQAAKSI